MDLLKKIFGKKEKPVATEAQATPELVLTPIEEVVADDLVQEVIGDNKVGNYHIQVRITATTREDVLELAKEFLEKGFTTDNKIYSQSYSYWMFVTFDNNFEKK